MFVVQSEDVGEVRTQELGSNNFNAGVQRTETPQQALAPPRENGSGGATPNYIGNKFASQAQTVLYTDEARDAIYDVSSKIPKAIDSVIAMDVAHFLSRPRKITSVTWNGATALGTDLLSALAPYDNFLSGSRISPKVDNFAFIRGTMKVKIVINSTPFNYGALRLVWQPNARAGTGITMRVPLTANSANFVPLSQLPGAWLYPQNNQGITMTLPYTNPYTWIDIRGSTFNYWRPRDMGLLNLVVYNQLQSANGATPSVTIAIYSWMENVELSAPSTTIYNQSGDRVLKRQPNFGKRFVPRANSVAPAPREYTVSDQIQSASEAISTMEDVPIFGDFAKVASQIGKGVAKVGKALGFSDPTSISDVPPIKMQNAPVFASPDISYPYQPLAIDYKNEVTIDPAICGIKTEDELHIRDFASKESYLTTITIDQTTTAEQVLATFNVTPNLRVYDNVAGTGYSARHIHTPLSLSASLFDYWRGSIKLRFVVVASPYHKARIKLQHEPAPNNVNYYASTGFEETLQTAILDVGVDQDYTMTIPYENYAAWLRCGDIDDASSLFGVQSTTLTGNNAYSPSYSNGQVYLRLLTTLSGPTATSTVYINVFVSGGDDFELASPAELSTYTVGNARSLWVRQSSDKLTIVNKESTMVGEYKTEEASIPSSISVPDMLYHTYMGEKVENFRQLLRRKVKYATLTMPTAPAGMPSLVQFAIPSVPLFPGYNPNGYHLARNIAASANIPFSFGNITPFALLKACFLGWRGSMNWLITDDFRTINGLVANKYWSLLTPTPLATFSQITAPTAAGRIASSIATNTFETYTAPPILTSGGAYEPRETGAPLAITLPYYALAKMLPGDDSVVARDGVARRPTDILVSGTVNAGLPSQISAYSSIGIDFNVFYFQYVPILYNVDVVNPV